MHVVELPSLEEIESLDADGRRAVLRHLRDVEGLVAVARSQAIVVEEAAGSFRREGFRSVRQMVQATANVAKTTAVGQVRLAHALAEMPLLRDALVAGRIGVDQAGELARLHANPACRQQLARCEQILVDQAGRLWFDGLVLLARRFRDLADPDGSACDHEASWRNRRVGSDVVGHGWQARIHGDGLSAAEFDSLLAVYSQLEWDKDWADAVAVHGPDTAARHVRRTARQRRFDALMAIIHTAAAHTPQLRGQPLANILVDQQTAHDIVDRAAGEQPSEVDVADELFTRHCHTGTGHSVSADQVLQAFLHGQIRGVIVDAAQHPVQASSVQRFFGGRLRHLAVLASPHCTAPACDAHPLVCDVDHLHPHAAGGRTSLANSNVCCSSDNLSKQRLGLRTRRDRDGQLHTHARDGTEIAPRTGGRRWTRNPKPP